MSRIDCSVTVNFLKEQRRMCGEVGCADCALSYGFPAIFHHGCGVLRDPERSVEIVQKWSDEHPVKTRLDDLMEKYPKFEVFSETGRPMYKPRMFGYCTDCSTCPNNKAEHCWHEPVDGGATGKAVE